jgi:hypothetical protein
MKKTLSIVIAFTKRVVWPMERLRFTRTKGGNFLFYNDQNQGGEKNEPIL